MKTFEYLAHEFSLAETRARKLIFVSFALAAPDVEAEINKHKDGWLGTEGQFARVLARMLSQLE